MKTGIRKNAWITHATLWLSYFLLLVWFYSEMRSFEGTLLRSLYIVSIQACIFYLNYYLLLPKLFENKKYIYYGVAVVALIAVSLALFYWFDKMNFSSEFPRMGRGGRPGGWRGGHFRLERFDERIKMSIIHRHVLFNGFFIAVVLFISTILRNRVVSRRRENEAIRLRNQALEAESRMLKWQINPHFLFNTLNNIYYLSQVKSEKASGAVHRLSEMLRYVIYDCNENHVSLGQEIRYLESYIELQLMKEESGTKVNYDFTKLDPSLKIAPLLLISFVENSFKHSRIGESPEARIDIRLETQDNQMIFEAKNSIPPVAGKKDNIKGIGLENVRRRLMLLYRDRHHLFISEKEHTFEVKLIMELDDR